MARAQVDQARMDTGPRAPQAVHRAEQVLLLVKLAADSGARLGELAALQIADLDGRDALTISRAASMEVIGPTKTGTIGRRGRTGSREIGVSRDRVDRSEWVLTCQRLQRLSAAARGRDSELGHEPDGRRQAVGAPT